MTQTYLSIEQVTARLAQRTVSTDQRRLAWDALSEADRSVCAERAMAAIDAVVWRGRVLEPDQAAMWPRLDPGGSGLLDADPAGSQDALVEGIPRALKDAFALQCGHEALAAAGMAPGAHVEDMARLGVTAHAAAGSSESIDLRAASSPWARLCTEAQRAMGHLRATLVPCA